MRRCSRWPLVLIAILCSLLQPSVAGDTITPGESFTDGKSLVSLEGKFKLGFFSPGNSKFRYLGIWYNTIPVQTVIWVANRDSPLTDSSGVLTISGNGSLLLSDAKGQVYWSTATAGVYSPIASLLDNANFVVTGNNSVPGSYAWQSFYYPTDSLLPGMKLRLDLRTGKNSKNITSWSNPDDPAMGEFAMRLDGNQQISLLYGTNRVWTADPGMNTDEAFRFNFGRSPNEVYVSFDALDSFVPSRMVAEPTGLVQHLVWKDSTEGAGAWRVSWYAPKDHCDNVSLCGPFGVCDINNSPMCSCVRGFHPRDGRDGCTRRTALDCRNGTDGFVQLAGGKLPGTLAAVVNYYIMGLEECREACLRNCSCTAYANAEVTGGGRGCILWRGDLTGLRLYTNGGQDLFVRLAAADLEYSREAHKRWMPAVMAVVAVLGVLLLGCIGWYTCRRKKKTRGTTKHSLLLRWMGCYTSWRKKTTRVMMGTSTSKTSNNKKEETSGGNDLELPLYDFKIIAAATDDFAIQNKLGEGGFGPVYLGLLVGGQEVAVKRLAKNSAQGLDELKNEVMLIAKLQHRNLVRLLGCCIQGEERMLIYEYMPNKSLDAFLFHETKGPLLDWKKRHHIINGIARGLLYLHQDSRFRIIHRDLKTGNVLLDKDMNPKISDFGLARICGGDETGANTRRVVGTYGYMSPEYIMEGVFSVKSDVFSFGVVVLEIVSGKRNRGIFLSDPNLNLLGYAWSLWKAGKVLELVDSSMAYSLHLAEEVLKCVKVGLLCVQERPEDRPTMASVVHLLCSDTEPGPQPKQPGFMATRGPFELSSSHGGKPGSVNDVTVTTFEGR